MDRVGRGWEQGSAEGHRQGQPEAATPQLEGVVGVGRRSQGAEPVWENLLDGKEKLGRSRGLCPGFALQWPGEQKHNDGKLGGEKGQCPQAAGSAGEVHE